MRRIDFAKPALVGRVTPCVPHLICGRTMYDGQLAKPSVFE
jgi:hypothetical protein